MCIMLCQVGHIINNNGEIAYNGRKKGSVFRHMEARWLSGRASDSGPRGPEFEPHDRCVVSLRKALSPSQSTNNTQEEVAPSQHD